MWRRFLAFTRLSLTAVCDESRGQREYHTYRDADGGIPQHLWALECRRCGKEFFV